MNDTRQLPCAECGKTLVTVTDYVEGDENEVVCDQCGCSHDERDHGICLDCGDEEDPGAAIDRAMDAMEDR